MNIKIEELRLEDRPIDYSQLILNILGSYPIDLSHGVQKDAIQNGWDAKDKEKNDWKYEFEIIKIPRSNKVAVLMSDYGTFGLTGEMTAKDVYASEDIPEEERWAR